MAGAAGCATVAEVRKRGDDFWNEFEFYLSDMVVGLVMDIVLVALMAPTTVLGAPRPASTSGVQHSHCTLMYVCWGRLCELHDVTSSMRLPRQACSQRCAAAAAAWLWYLRASGWLCMLLTADHIQRACARCLTAPGTGACRVRSASHDLDCRSSRWCGAGLQRLLAKVPSAAFAPSQPGRRYSGSARLACFGVKFAEYSLAGIICGLVGQGIANALIRAKYAPVPETVCQAVCGIHGCWCLLVHAWARTEIGCRSHARNLACQAVSGGPAHLHALALNPGRHSWAPRQSSDLEGCVGSGVVRMGTKKRMWLSPHWA